MNLKSALHRLNRRDLPLFPRLTKFSKIVIISVLFYLASQIVTYIKAQTSDIPLVQYQQAIKDGNNQEAWLDNALSANAVSIFSGLYGEIPQEYFDYFNQTGQIPKVMPQGMLGQSTKMIASLFTPPASGIEYIAELKNNILGKPAYAQGVGFTHLQFLLPLWKSFRNVVYILSALIFVVMGIMITLRVKISPQAVISIQSAIPQIISTLILVTFSYAIAGLVIDLGNLLLGVIIALLFSAQKVNLQENLIPTLVPGTGFPIASDIGNLIQAGYQEAASWFGASKPLSFNYLANPNFNTLNVLTFRATPGWWSLISLGGLIGSIVLGSILSGTLNIFGGVGNDVGQLAGGVVGGIVGGVLSALILPIILGIVIGFWLVKLFFGLIKTYVNIIIQIIFSPFIIGIGAFPGAKTGFNTWLLELFANISVFPIITAFLVILNLIIDSINTPGANTAWAPGLLDGPGNGIISSCIGLAGLALLSKLPEMIPQFIFMIKPSPFGQAIGQGLGDLNPKKVPIIGGAISGAEKSIQETFGRGVVESRPGTWVRTKAKQLQQKIHLAAENDDDSSSGGRKN